MSLLRGARSSISPSACKKGPFREFDFIFPLMSSDFSEKHLTRGNKSTRIINR